MHGTRRIMIVLASLIAVVAAVVLLEGSVSSNAASDSTAQAAPLSDAALARSLPGGFGNGYATVNGVRLHYVAGGRGTPLVLLPGWPETWWAFHKIMPALAAHHRVIAVDLPGMGGSAKPAGGYDLTTMAADIHALAARLGYSSIGLVGHDIGAMVANVYGLVYPQGVTRLALMDVVAPDASLYQLPLLPVPGQFYPWWWAFNQVRGLPEQLVAGRSRVLVDTMIDGLAHVPGAITNRDREIYARAYSTQDDIRAADGWYQSLPRDIADSKAYGKLTVPLLGLASVDNYRYFQMVLPTKATDFRVVEVAGSGHYLSEEQPAEVEQALTAFFG